MNKKGVSVILMIFEVLTVILVVTILINVANAYNSSWLTKKTQVAEDVRLMVDTLVGVPGNARVIYPEDTTELIFDLNDNNILVFRKGEDQSAGIKRLFSLPKGYKATGFVEDKPQICIEKKNNKLELNDCT
tara:strand:- start:621 stop:1016 length:396 start_codon:yes stop_codon:yes gene_type:complete